MLEKKEKSGLVLEGGAKLGVYSAGVVDVLMKQGIVTDGVIGVSAGAIIGLNYASWQRGRSIKMNIRYCREKKFMSWRSFLETGNIVDTQFCYHDIPDRLIPFDHGSFERSATKFYAVCTNIETGKAEYVLCGDARSKVEYIRASASMPFLSNIVEIDGKKLLDGYLSDPIPLRRFQEMGYGKCIVVQTKTADYREKPEYITMSRLFYREYPNLIKDFEENSALYNETLEFIDRQEKEGKIIRIRPSRKMDISKTEHDPMKIHEE